ncbi:MAG TPA: hypothetical protein VK498_02465 [Ferruginibacter sp.]|nr:hypothetical protein [Ferruginibacter sp.]
MTEATGKISFINHQKDYAMIEYEQSGKKKTIKGIINEKVQAGQREKKLLKKPHQYIIGDVVKFNIKIADRGDRMMATDIRFMYNTSLDELLNKAKTENRFTGYLKMADGKYFIKEIGSYLFFPVAFSPWQILPNEQELNEPVSFFLENPEKKEKITAALFTNSYIPEFHTAVKKYKNKTLIEAEIYRITSHSIYLDLVNNKILAKISTSDLDPLYIKKLAPGDKINVLITYLSKSRIVVKTVNDQVGFNNMG